MSGPAISDQEKELLRRATEARRLIKHEDLDPWLALGWVTAPEHELDTAYRWLEERKAA